MWRSRTAASCRDTLVHGLGEDLVAEVFGGGQLEIHPAAVSRTGMAPLVSETGPNY